MSIIAFPDNTTCLQFMADGGIANADSDISGEGVILAFVLSAYLTFAAVMAAYVFGQVDASLLNVVDTQVFRVRPYRPSASFMRKGRPTRLRIHDALRSAILALSDQQIVTGIAIMGAGFQGLNLGGIDSYHYQIILYLAWMSSSVHLSALSLLSPILNKRPALKVWRLVGMLVLLVLLLVGLVPTVSNDWGLTTWSGMKPGHSGWGVPAICFFGETWGDGVNPDAVLGFLLLIVSYVWKVGALYPRPCYWYYRWVRHPIAWAFETLVAKLARRYHAADPIQHPLQRTIRLWFYRSALAPWVPTIAVLETLASFSAAIWISAGGLIFGTIQIFIPRAENYDAVGQQEGTWGFGQLVPLILLIQPLGALWEHLLVHEAGRDGEEDDDADSTQDSASHSLTAHDDIPMSRLLHNCALRGSSATSNRLLGYLQEHRPPSVLARIGSHTSPMEDMLMKTWLFRANVLFIQPALIAASGLIFTSDAFGIGYTTSGNWFSISIIVGGYVGASWILTLVLAPWSRMGNQRATRRQRPSESMELAKASWTGQDGPYHHADDREYVQEDSSGNV